MMISKSTRTRNNEEAKPASDRNTWVLFVVLAALVFSYFSNTFIVFNSRVVGSSMAPLLNENDWIIANRLQYIGTEPSVGDVIVFRKKSITNEPIVKRVAGAQGDIIEVADGITYLNNNRIESIYEELNPSENRVRMVVPQNCYFVLGDNRNLSNDSRVWKDPFVRGEDIIGKVVLKYFPEIKTIH
ncbi:MAG: signal peptidase I [Christensenellales bacterium]